MDILLTVLFILIITALVVYITTQIIYVITFIETTNKTFDHMLPEQDDD